MGPVVSTGPIFYAFLNPLKKIPRIDIIGTMLSVNQSAPLFSLPAVENGKSRILSLKELKGKWVVLFFYPKDFTFVCPTEVIGFHNEAEAFRKEDAVILAASPDSVETHEAWAKELGGIAYPLLSDPDRALSRSYGVLDPKENLPLRVTYIIDPAGIIAYAVASHMNVGRSVEETFRVLCALKTKKLCPADWQPGEETLDPQLKY